MGEKEYLLYFCKWLELNGHKGEDSECYVESFLNHFHDDHGRWQPISTAPKDGTWILLRGRNSVGRPMIPVVAAWRYERYSWSWYDSGSLKNLHDLAASADGAEWMPLP